MVSQHYLIDRYTGLVTLFHFLQPVLGALISDYRGFITRLIMQMSSCLHAEGETVKQPKCLKFWDMPFNLDNLIRFNMPSLDHVNLFSPCTCTCFVYFLLTLPLHLKDTAQCYQYLLQVSPPDVVGDIMFKYRCPVHSLLTVLTACRIGSDDVSSGPNSISLIDFLLIWQGFIFYKSWNQVTAALYVRCEGYTRQI